MVAKCSIFEEAQVVQTFDTGVICDNWIPGEPARAVAADWPDERWPHWHRYDDGKLATKDPDRLPASAKEVVRMMLNISVSRFYKACDGAFPDFNLHGAGMHCHPSGSRLGMHCDAEIHPLTGWTRVCSAILYVEPDWKQEWGGSLIIEPGHKIEPKFRRLVIFPTKGVLHGMPTPVRCPVGQSRKSLAVFFWKESKSPTAGATKSEFVN